LLRHCEQMLGSALSGGAEQRVSKLELMSAAERGYLVEELNRTEREYGAADNVAALIAAQVQRGPGAVAVEDEEERLSYEELAVRAKRVGAGLRRRGVQAEALVGVMMERSVGLVVGLLGVWQAGGAYVPLERSEAVGRLREMVEGSGLRLVLTQAREQAAVAELMARVASAEVAVVSVEELEQEGARYERESRGEPRAGGDNLAYVIYTSGSTGKPKGVMISHRAICNRLLWMQDEYQLTGDDCVLQKTPYTFDVSVWEFFWPLITGARLLMARPGGHQNSVYLKRLIATRKVTTLHFVPSMLQVFLEEEDLEETCRSVRQVISSGEALSSETQEKFFKRVNAKLHNLYGPTETAVDVTFWECKPEARGERVPIGHPIANIQAYILDVEMQPAPVGVAGELYLGGVGLGRGYQQQPGLTAERFVPHPYARVAGARLYRTGDVARYRGDGAIEFLGRVDQQVKLRGYRIELGEIESVLRQHEAVREAVVVMRGAGVEQRLVGYVTAAGRNGGSSAGRELSRQLREHLQGRVPEYMVPGALVVLERLPLSANGKLDRAALPEPENFLTSREGSGEQPLPGTERILAEIWESVLGVGPIGRDADFFDLGGHSLLAMRVISRLRKVLQVEVPIEILFEAPALSQLARRITNLLQGEAVATPPMRAVSRDETMPLSFAQQRLWMVEQYEPDTAAYNIPADVRLSGPLKVSALENSLNEIVRRHETLRTSFISQQGQPVQVISPALKVQLSLIDLQELPEAERETAVARLAKEEMRVPFNLAQAPLLRATLVRLRDDEHVFLLTMHHIVSDGWSIEILMREMSALYEAFVTGKDLSLSDLPIQYADFAHWQREWLQGEVFEKQLAYWTTRLHGNLPVLSLPADRPHPPAPTFAGATQEFVPDQSLTEAFRSLSRREGTTMFMTLVAAFKILLYRYARQEDIVVGTNVAGRNWLETEGLIGFFLNQLVLRTNLSGNPTFRELLHRVREGLLGAYAHQDMPFDRLVEALVPERDISRTPLFQVKVDLQNTSLPLPQSGDLKLTPLNLEHPASHFDLLLLLAESDRHLHVALHYKTDLFDEDTITRMLENFEQLLRHIVTRPDARLSELTELIVEADVQRRLSQQRERKELNIAELKKVKRREVVT